MPRSAPPPAPDFAALAPPDGLLRAALDISLTGFILLRPVYGPVAEDAPAPSIDLACVYLNPAAQRMLKLPECPTESFLTLYPNTRETGVFAFHRDTFLSGQPGRYDVNYQADGLDNFYQLADQRSGELLLVSFTDTADQPRTAVERALRESQAVEQAAYAEANRQRQQLHNVFEQTPAMICILEGPEHVFQFVNPPYQALVGARPLLGRPIAEALPELAGQDIFGLLDKVYQTGEALHAYEMPVQLDRADDAGAPAPEVRYYNFIYQARHSLSGTIDGILAFAYDVTTQVLARRQTEQMNAALEARVAERTQTARTAQAEAQAIARHLTRLTESLPSTTFATDQAGQVLYISPQWYTYTGMAPGIDINEAWPELIHPDDLPAVAREFGAALAAGRPWSYEFRLRGADGRYRWFASQGQPEPAADAEAAGRPRQWFGSNLDIEDLRQAQHELEQQARRQREILTQSPALIGVTTGPEHRFSFTNPGYDALVEGRAELGRTVVECFPEAVAQGFIDLLDGVYRTGQPHEVREIPAVLQTPGREPAAYFLDIIYQPLRDEQGLTTGVLAFVLDVTEQVRARAQTETLQAELLAAAGREARERVALYEVFEESPALICIFRGPKHRYDYFNAAYQRQFAGRELRGRPVAEALPEVVAQGFVELLDGVYRTGETFFGQELLLTIDMPDGTPSVSSYYNLTYQACREDGEIVGISVFAYDVTGQVLARRERETQRQQLQQVFEQAPVAICVFRGAAHVLEVVNSSMATLIGRPLAELQGRPLLAAMPEIASQNYGALLDQVRAMGVPYVAHEQPATWLRDGQSYTGFLNYVYQPLRDEQGQVTGVVCVSLDVTPQVLARQQIIAANAALTVSNEQLTRTNVDLDTFIYTASHDLKAPITNIEGLLGILRGELPPAGASNPAGEVSHILDLMQGSVERFQKTIEHLTDVSKLQKEYTGEASAPVPLAPVVEGVRLDLAPLLHDTAGRLRVDVRAVPTVRLSEKNLRSVVFNLLSNALKYHHPDRRPDVRLRAYPQGRFAVLEVRDNGLGLNLSDETKLFAMFQRLHTHVEGSGVGLYMVKRLVENAGGQITVESQIGEGSTFTVRLPL